TPPLRVIFMRSSPSSASPPPGSHLAGARDCSPRREQPACQASARPSFTGFGAFVRARGPLHLAACRIVRGGPGNLQHFGIRSRTSQSGRRTRARGRVMFATGAFASLLMMSLAAVLEVGGDALIRKGLHARSLLVTAVGFLVLGSYGIAVNLLSLDFSR